MSDNFEYIKSISKQSISVETPFVSKQWNYIPDSNGNSYQSQGLCPLNFDLSSLIGDSDTMLGMSEALLLAPICLTSAWTNSNLAGTTVSPNLAQVSAWASTVMKPYYNLIHSADVNCNGQSVEQPVSYLNIKTSFKLMSSMSADDLATLGPSLGFSDRLDNFKSQKYNGSNAANWPTGTGGAWPLSSASTTTAATNLTAYQGNGICNNVSFLTAGVSNDGNQSSIQQGGGTFNAALNRRAERLIDMTAPATANNSKLYGNDPTLNITSQANLNNELRPYFTMSGNILCYYDVAIIRLKDVFDFYAKLPLSRRIDSRLVLNLNLGSTGVMVFSGTNASGQMLFSGNSTTIGGTCPYTEVFLGGGTAIPSTAVGKSTAISIAKPAGVSAFGVNFSSAPTHTLNQCRIYYPVYKLKPEVMKEYISLNRHKQIMYEKSLYLPVFNISPTGQVNQPMVACRQIKSVLVVPVLSQATNGSVSAGTTITGVIPFGQHQSPFDQFPQQTAPISLTNFNVMVGNVSVLNTAVNYSYEQFLEHFNVADPINGTDLGLSCGLIGDAAYNNSFKMYYLNLERGSESQQMDLRSIIVQFTNNCIQQIDCHIFVSYYQSCVLDIETSELKML